MNKVFLSVMMMTMLFILIVAEASGADFNFSRVDAKGTGCPIGTTSIVSTQDQNTVSILFDEMRVELPQYDLDNDNDVITDENPSRGRKDDPFYSHKTCAINIDATIAEGQQVDSVEISVDFRGMSFLDTGVQALFHSQFVEFKGPRAQSRRAKDMVARKVWRNGGVDEDWLIEATKVVDVKSECASRGDLQAHFSLLNIVKAQIQPQYRNRDVTGLISLDSTDLKAALKVKVHTSPCRGGGRPNSGNNPRTDEPQRPDRPSRGQGICPRGYVFSPSFGRCIPSRR